MLEKQVLTWYGWDIPKDVEQEVSYLVSLLERTKNKEDHHRIRQEINDLIVWASNDAKKLYTKPRLGMPIEELLENGDKPISRKEAILAQKERHE